jgi:hypothetical protein
MTCGHVQQFCHGKNWLQQHDQTQDQLAVKLEHHL